MTNSPDRREGLRYVVNLPVQLEQGSGVTRNASRSGVLFETDQVFPAGAPIKLTMLLEHAYPETTCVHCQGKIVRTEQIEGKNRVAVAFTSMGFEWLPRKERPHRSPSPLGGEGWRRDK